MLKKKYKTGVMVNMVQKTKAWYVKHLCMFHQAIMYGLIGGGSSLLDTLCYIFFTRNFEWNKYFSNFLSINLGITCSFFLNTYFNFRKTDKLAKRGLSFFCIGYCGMALSVLLMFIGVDLLRFNDITVKLISIFIVALFQFILNKIVTFSKI